MGFMQNDIKIMLFTRFSLRTMCAASATKIIENQGKHIKTMKKQRKSKQKFEKNASRNPLGWAWAFLLRGNDKLLRGNQYQFSPDGFSNLSGRERRGILKKN